MYIYPDNLKAAPMLFLWRLKDLAVIGIGALISVFAMSQTGFSLPVIITLVYAFLAIRHDDIRKFSWTFGNRCGIIRCEVIVCAG